MGPKPHPRYLGEQREHRIEHAEDLIDTAREDELFDLPVHEAEPDRRPEEPSGESGGSTES